jgi:hypothetical protein
MAHPREESPPLRGGGALRLEALSGLEAPGPRQFRAVETPERPAASPETAHDGPD